VFGEEVIQDTGIGILVQVGGKHSVRILGTFATDGQREAKGVILGSILVSGRMKGNHLMSEHIVAGRNVERDTDVPRQIILQQYVCSPEFLGRVEEANFVNLEEFEFCFVG